MNNNKKFIVATIAGIALCCTMLAAPGPRGGRHGGPGGRAPAHHVQRPAPHRPHHAHRPAPAPGHHHHHRDGLGLAAGIVSLVHDVIAPEPVVVQQPPPVVQATPVIYQTTTPVVYRAW